MSRGLRILLSHVYCWPEHRRGGERYLHELAAHLHRAGHHVDVLSTAPTAGRAEVLGVPVRMLKRRRLLPSRYGEVADQVGFGMQSLLPAVRGRYDVWHATSVPDGAAAAWLSRRRPGLCSVFTDHGFPARVSRERRPDHALFSRLVNDVGSYVCVSEPAAGFLRSDYGRDPLVIPPGVDTDVFTPDQRRHSKPVVLYVGSLAEPRKNVAVLLDAVALLAVDVPDLEVWLIGQGDASALLAGAPAAAREQVTVCGPQVPAALPELYRAAWVTVLASDAEVFGMAVAESMACGTPAVVLDDGLGPSTIVTPGTGVLAGRSAAELAAALAAGLELAAQRSTRDACRSRAEDFDWRRRVVPQLVAAYRGEATP